MLDTKTALNPKSYYDNGIDLILIEAMSSTACEEVMRDVYFE